MIGPVSLGGKWWAHNGACSMGELAAHVHYAENVIMSIESENVPDLVFDEYLLLFGDPKAKPLPDTFLRA